MMLRKTPWIGLAVTLALLGLNLVAVNYLVAGWSTARIDLTSEGLFSISDATRRLLAGLDEEVTIYGYFSKRTHPKLAPLVPEVEDLLAEYRAVSKGLVHVEMLDPGSSERAEDEAANRFGVRSTPFRLASKYESAIVNAYFAVVVRFGDQYVRYGFEDLIEIEPTPDGDVDIRLRNLEYDLTRAIKKVVFGFRGASELFERVDEPVTLTAIWTEGSLPELLADVPAAVREAAAQLEETGGDGFDFEIVDPGPSEELKQAVYDRFGARPMALGLFGEEEFYLYALLEIGDRLEQIPLTGGDVTAATVREAVENALRRNTPGFLKTVGVATSAPPQIPHEVRMQMQLPPEDPPEFQEVKRILGEDYVVREVDLGDEDGVPSEVDILLVLKPKQLDEGGLFNLDQYLMRGGRVILCAGNFDVRFDATGLGLTPIDSGLDEWLAHYGVTIDKTLVLDDRNQPLPLPEIRQTPFGAMRTWVLAPYPYLVQVREDGFLNREITATLDAVGVYWGSPIHIDETRTAEFDVRPILRSSERSWTSDDLSAVNYVDYTVPADGTEPQMLAVALSGRFESFFAEHETPNDAVALVRSPETRLIVIGNAEFLSDFVARALARVEGGFFSENLRFAQNLIDWVALDNDMLQIRARGMVSRRLDAIEPGREIVIETANYVIPLVALALLGAWISLRRRRTEPLVRRNES